jgi:predicted DsbA family dithiol-disulfide isomerase
MISIDEAVWAAAGITLVPYLVIVDRSARLLGSASPWPDHVAALSSEDMPLLAGCS